MTPAHASGAQAPSVLFITRAFPPITGGMEHLSGALTASIGAHTRTRIIANRRGKSFLPFFLPIAAGAAVTLSRHFDVVHVGDPLLAGIGHLARWSSGRPIVTTVHGLDILYAHRGYQAYLRATLPSLNLCVCISRYTQTVFHEKFGDAVPSVVIPPGMSDDVYAPAHTREELRTLLQTDVRERHVLLTVGRLVPRKGVRWFVEHVLPKLPNNVLYVVAGEGPDTANIQRAAAHDPRVILTGPISSEQRQLLYNTADLFVMPNIPVPNTIEGFGIVALEAASCSLPVVAARLEGIPDAVADEKTGVLVESGNAEMFRQAITDLLNNPARRTAISETARPWVLQHFAWTEIAKRYLSEFQKLLN